MTSRTRILIVGGVAGGASCAVRARRLSESTEIIIFDRGEHISFANCGLPYYVGDIIKEEEKLLVTPPELFHQRFNIQVRLQCEVVSIDRVERCIHVRDLGTQQIISERYDVLVLSPGAYPILPNLQGINLPGIFSLRTIPDSRRIRSWIGHHQVKQAMVIGGGYIGMEVAENLHRRGIQVSVVEQEQQVMPLFDPEIVTPLHKALAKAGIGLLLNDSVDYFEKERGHRLNIFMKSGKQISTDIVILSTGVRPEIGLAQNAGLAIGNKGGIRVDSQMRTSDPHIFAVGDAIEVKDVATNLDSVVPLAGPANRQGRIAAEVIMGRNSTFRGVQGTSVVGIFDQVLALTGPSEKTLKKLSLWDNMEKIYLHPNDHAGYYPGSSPITLKLIFNRRNGQVVSAQAVGTSGVEKRIDVISMAIQKHATVYDLEEAELCYAPQFGSAKDPINLAGMIAANVLRGDSTLIHWDEVSSGDSLMLDVRTPEEFQKGHLDGALNMPLDQLRERMSELPRKIPILNYCFLGQRSYYAERLLTQYGFTVRNISGGYKLYMLQKVAQGSVADPVSRLAFTE